MGLASPDMRVGQRAAPATQAGLEVSISARWLQNRPHRRFAPSRFHLGSAANFSRVQPNAASNAASPRYCSRRDGSISPRLPDARRRLISSRLSPGPSPIPAAGAVAPVGARRPGAALVIRVVARVSVIQAVHLRDSLPPSLGRPSTLHRSWSSWRSATSRRRTTTLLWTIGQWAA